LGWTATILRYTGLDPTLRKLSTGSSEHRLLTPRRRQVLHAVARGLTNKEIASELAISEQAVKVHVSALLLQFGVSTRTALVRVAAQRGVIDLSA
jgi:DNA-binding NarL/FixJ family response regulator